MKKILLISLFLSSVLLLRAERICYYHHNRQMTSEVKCEVKAPDSCYYTATFKKGVAYQFWEYYDDAAEEGHQYDFWVADTSGNNGKRCKFVHNPDYTGNVKPNSNEVD